MAGKCGSCTACCRVYSIPELSKPAGKWCQHCAIGNGCKIYEQRPQMCVEYECLWLQSQQRPGAEMAEALRPDRCKVVFAFTTNPKIINAMTLPGAPLAWERKDVRAFIDKMNGHGYAVAIGPPATRHQTVLYPGNIRREVEMTEPDENGMQWSINADKGV